MTVKKDVPRLDLTYQCGIFSGIQMKLYAAPVPRLGGEAQVVLHQRVPHHDVVQHGVPEQNQDGEHKEHERASFGLREAVFRDDPVQ